MNDYRPRFVTEAQLNDLLDCFRRTAVGYSNWRPSKYERTVRAVEMFMAHNVGVNKNGAYKDLSSALEGYTPLTS